MGVLTTRFLAGTVDVNVPSTRKRFLVETKAVKRGYGDLY